MRGGEDDAIDHIAECGSEAEDPDADECDGQRDDGCTIEQLEKKLYPRSDLSVRVLEYALLKIKSGSICDKSANNYKICKLLERIMPPDCNRPT